MSALSNRPRRCQLLPPSELPSTTLYLIQPQLQFLEQFELGMGMNDEGLLLGLPFPNSIIGVHIPRRRRSGSSESKPKHEACISMFEAARILIAMANGGFCKGEIETKNGKRKKSPTTTKKQRKKRRKEIELPNTPEMPAAMRDRIVEMGGYGIALVIQKQLQDTDMNKNHGRLSLPPKKVKIDFVTEEERKLLNEQNQKNKKGMKVMIMDAVLRESWICLKKWKIGSDQVYCLMTNWNSFVEQSDLRSGDCIQLWSFRKDRFDPQTGTMASHQLCFAMVKLDLSD